MAASPRVLVSASGIGYYGSCDDRILTEDSPLGGDFLAELGQKWEAEASKAEALGIRVVRARLGVILSKRGGALPMMMRPIRLGVGGRIGSGRQWMSWIERDDLVRLIAHVIASSDISGPVNATAPIPVTNNKFTEELARRLHRPAVFRIPDALLRRFGGDFASELLLGGQRVIPNKALSHGFVFRHETLRSAFEAIL